MCLLLRTIKSWRLSSKAARVLCLKIGVIAGGVVQSNPYAMLGDGVGEAHDGGSGDEDADWRPSGGSEGSGAIDLATDDSSSGVYMRGMPCSH